MATISAGVKSRRGAVALLLAVLAGGVVWYLARHADEFVTTLGMVDPGTLLLVTLLRVVGLALSVQAAVVVFSERAPRLEFGEYLVVSTLGVLAGNLSLGGSSISKAVYLNRRHGVPLVAFGGLHAMLLLSAVATSSLASMIGLVILGVSGGNGLWPLWLLAGAGVAAGVAPLVAGAPLLAWAARAVPRMHTRLGASRASFEARRIVRRVWPWLLLRAGIGFCAMGWLFTAFAGHTGALYAGGTLEGLAVACNLVRITPGNLGVYEWVVALLGGRLGFSLTSALAAALTYRVLGLAAAAVGSVLAVSHKQLLARAKTQ